MTQPHIEAVARLLATQWNDYHFGRAEDSGWEQSVSYAEFAWFQADKAAKAAGYISIWSPSMEVRERFIAAAVEAFRESYT